MNWGNKQGIKNNVSRNIIVSVMLQICTLINGLIVPRIILSQFGSDVNGLVSSITQFLNYITVLEGGVGAVVMAALYRPLAERDNHKVSAIINAAKSFFRKIAIVYAVYAIVLMIVGPILIWEQFDRRFTASLVAVIAINTFVQYYFSLSYRILLNADRKVYIVTLTQMVCIALNLAFSIIVARIYPEIHALKIANALAFCVQPLVFASYVKKHYVLFDNEPNDSNALEQRWDGFGQNIAYVIHMNTDIAVLTVFSNLANVSIYMVYNLIVTALKNIVVAISGAVLPTVGRIYVRDDLTATNKAFSAYEWLIGNVTTFLFTCGAVLVNHFVAVYTVDITDANYFQPTFGLLIMVAIGIGCIREPYINMANTAGRFKDIAKYAYWEAIINITVSIVLVSQFGLIGVIIGTLVASVYRLVAQVMYLKRNVLFRPIGKSVKSIVSFIVVFSGSYMVTSYVNPIQVNNYLSWFLDAVYVAFIVGVFTALVTVLFHRETIRSIVRSQV